MIKGGYQIINLKGNNLTTNPVTIPGIYDSIEGNYSKPLLLSGIHVDGLEKADVFVSAETNAGSYVFTVYGGNITITSEDAVTFTK